MRKNIFLLSSLVIAIGVSFFLFKNYKFKKDKQMGAIVEDTISMVDAYIPSTLYGIIIDSLEVEEKFVERNENLSEIFKQYNVPMEMIAQLNFIPKDTFDVRKVKAKNPYTIIYKSNDSIKMAKALVYHENAIEYVVFQFIDSLNVTRGRHPVDTIETALSGTIEYSLYQTVVDNGGTPLLVNALADVYAWEIDFFGLQKNDQFKVIYDEIKVKGKVVGMGKIKGAWFKHMDVPHYAICYDQGEGEEYFDKEGKSLRKTFLKAPLQYNRISSTFSNSRYHPVLKISRPHHGVDYAAPKGTPVHAVGDGNVTKKGYYGGAGNMVKIKHNSNYETAYLHLSKFAPDVHVGSRVRQGQLIGYVGSTGLSTGPHLDFRFYKNGKAINPLTVDPPSATPIKEELMPEYQKVMQVLAQKLDSISVNEVEQPVL